MEEHERINFDAIKALEARMTGFEETLSGYEEDIEALKEQVRDLKILNGQEVY